MFVTLLSWPGGLRIGNNESAPLVLVAARVLFGRGSVGEYADACSSSEIKMSG